MNRKKKKKRHFAVRTDPSWFSSFLLLIVSHSLLLFQSVTWPLQNRLPHIRTHNEKAFRFHYFKKVGETIPMDMLLQDFYQALYRLSFYAFTVDFHNMAQATLCRSWLFDSDTTVDNLVSPSLVDYRALFESEIPFYVFFLV
jgi:hypothetical protein